MDLAAFLAARLDEDEAAAKGPPGWKLEHWTAVRYADRESGRNYRVDAEPRCVVDAVAREDAEFIAEHDPARVLREVAAKRAILAEVIPMIRGMDDQIIGEWSSNPADAVADAHLPLLKIMAAVYAGHPDYDPAWAVSG